MAKNKRDYWYKYSDIDYILKIKSNDVDYYVADTASQNSEQALQRVNEVFQTLKDNPEYKAAVIPINLGSVNADIYTGSHWVGLTISRDLETNVFKAYYTDSSGIPLSNSLSNLSIILTNHGILKDNIIDFQRQQQYNSYDCGAWTVLNLDSLARTGKLSEATEKDVIAQRSEVFGYLPNPPAPKVVPPAQTSSNTTDIEQKTTKSGDPYNDQYSVGLDESIGLDKLSIKPAPRFVANTIIFADGEESEDSSDEDFNELDMKLLKFDLGDQTSFPYRTSKITYDKQDKRKISQPVSLVLSHLLVSAMKNRRISDFRRYAAMRVLKLSKA